jgi:hypothetical protein
MFVVCHSGAKENHRMTRAVAGTILLVFTSVAYGQTADHQPAFEVVSIRPAPPPDPRWMSVTIDGGPGTHDPGFYVCENCDLSGVVSQAYGMYGAQLSAPDWMRDQRFNISAKVAMGATKDQFRLMLQKYVG